MTGRTKTTPRKTEEAELLDSSLKSARDLSCRDHLLAEKDAAKLLQLSPSWLAHARMRGDGPPYLKLRRSVRYSEAALLQWMKSCLRLSTSQR
jgi:predicted DNA-binding transcriptional regulator AlpA